MDLKQFSFPLNAYAAMLLWAEGRVDYLHYGLFESIDEPIWQAQERASRRLWAQMPPPCRVLEVGVGLGDTLARLRQRGYDAVGITPEPAQANAVHERHGAELAVHVDRLEDFAPEGAPFDLMVLQESAQYIQPLALFEAADRLLSRERASIVLMDEFALDRESDNDFGLHLWPHFVDLAKRFGWHVVHEEDVTHLALLTVDVLLRLTGIHGGRLRSELGVGEAELLGLDQSNRRYAGCYGRGIYGYKVLRLERCGIKPLRPVSLDAQRAPAMRALFQQVFGRQMGPAEWEWKYGGGRGRGIGLASRDDQMLAFYGGLSRPLWLFGRPALGCQVCDVMVADDARSSLTRRGPMHDVAATFLEAEIGWGRPHAVGFGFPTVRALEVAERLGLYQRVDEMVQLRWLGHAPQNLSGGNWRGELMPAAALPALASDIDAVWSAMAVDLGSSVLGVRDAAWLTQRYATKPDFAYEALLLRSWPRGELAGLLVFRRQEDHLEVLDLCGPPTMWPRLIELARSEAARSAAAQGIKAWVTRSHAHLIAQVGDGVLTDPLDMIIPANAYTPGLAPSALAGHWFLMAGDTDFR